MTNFVFDNPKKAGNVLVFDSPSVVGTAAGDYPPMNSDFLQWLKDPTAIRVILIEAVALVDGVETTRYISNVGWKSGPADTPANTHYEPIMTTGVDFTEQLTVDGRASLSVGDIEIDNANGDRESWMDDIWTNRSIKAWIGDERWNRAAFQPIFNGVMAPIARKSPTKLALKLRDKSKRLDGAMTEHKLGGEGANADSIIPLCFGECHNVTPLLIDAALLRYQVHDGAIEGILEVRVSGVPVDFTPDNATGTFYLVRNPSGPVTCSVWGDKFQGVYRNTVSSLVQRIVTGFGKDNDRFSTEDLDLPNLNLFEVNNQQAVGLYISDRTNVLIACQMLASSVGAQISMSRLGLLRLLKVSLTSTAGMRDVVQSEFVANEDGTTLTPNGTIDAVAAIKLNYCKNWTVQKGLITDIPAEHLELFASDWLTVSAVDPQVKADNKLSGDVIATDTMLIDEDEAQAQANWQLALWKKPHTTYEAVGYPELLELQLGQPIMVYNDQDSMSQGKRGIVMRLAPDYDNGNVRVGFMV